MRIRLRESTSAFFKRSALQSCYRPNLIRLGLAAAFLCLSPLTMAEELIVIRSHLSQPQEPLSRHALSAIFGMRLTIWPDGTPIRVFVLPDYDPAHAAFCKQVLHVFPHQLRAAWDRLVFSGTGQAPEPVASLLEMRSRLARTEGGIGYLTKDLIDETVDVLPLR